MYDDALGNLNTEIINVNQCYFPGILTHGAMIDRVGNWTLKLYKASKLWDSCQRISNVCENPDIFESLFYLWRSTFDSKFRDLGWKLVKSHGKCLNSFGLKFAYLLFSDESVYPLKDYVFSKSHPMSIRGKGRRKRYMPLEFCNDCVDGIGIDSLLHGALSD